MTRMPYVDGIGCGRWAQGRFFTYCMKNRMQRKRYGRFLL